MRLATKPGPSPTTAGRFPIPRKNSTSRPTISGAVAAEGMTSTPGVHSGGLNQCIPQKRPGRPTNSERALMGRDDVLETMTASCGAAEQEVRISSFNPMSSGTASKTRSASATVPATSSAVSTASTLPTEFSANSPALACPLARRTSRSFASLVWSGVASVSTTSIPAAAKHSATPNPIVPAPMTAALCGQPLWESRSFTWQALRSQDAATCDQGHRKKRNGRQSEERRTARVRYLLPVYGRVGHHVFGVIDISWLLARLVLIFHRRHFLIVSRRSRAVVGRWRRVVCRVSSLTRDARRGDDRVVAVRVEGRVGIGERRMVAHIVVDRSFYLRASVLVRDRDLSLLVGEDCLRPVAVFEGYGRTG